MPDPLPSMEIHASQPPPTPGALRACLSRFATGVTVVTYDTPEGPRGATMNSFTSVSAEPPLVLVSVARRARCHGPLGSGIPFCVNVLGAEQEAVARRFAGAPVPGEPEWAPRARVPRLATPLAWVECDPWRTYDGGDHTLVLGLVTALGHRDGDALTYAWSRFGGIAEAAEGMEYLI
ncbi:flavin reductase family protein [Phaeacidiphilus oryzae]|uniref:flavin reductase family protein n=1 Tax=Phaeacidiphilus oryzae TaxID=348818 RepID=UPI000566F0B0|nr:flavin reductase family protein [Phaeacidiphilus oryzae]